MTISPRQFLYQPGELAKVGQIWIIQSLTEADSKTGRRLYDELRDLDLVSPSGLRITFRDGKTEADLLEQLGELSKDIATTGRAAILDIECHGNEEGLSLGDGFFVSWDKLKPKLVGINLASRFNLILILGCCYGGYFGRVTQLVERSAFCAYIAPSNKLMSGDLFAGLLAFYRSLLVDRDLTRAVNAILENVPDFPFFCATAMGLFRMGFASYVRERNDFKSRWRRAKEIVARHRNENLAGPQPSIQDVVEEIRVRGPLEFVRCRRLYFAIDLLPENNERYALRYEEVLADGQKPFDASPEVINI